MLSPVLDASRRNITLLNKVQFVIDYQNEKTKNKKKIQDFFVNG